MLGLEDTTSNVDLDEIFAMFDKRTRKALSGVFRGSARQYAGEGKRATHGLALPRPRARVGQPAVPRAEPRHAELRRFLDESRTSWATSPSGATTWPGLVDNLADTTGAIARPRGALGEAIHRLPPFMRQANTTYVDLRAALDDLDPLVQRRQAGGEGAAPVHARAAAARQDAEPTVKDLAADPPAGRATT